jgi:hypothetical protein
MSFATTPTALLVLDGEIGRELLRSSLPFRLKGFVPELSLWLPRLVGR